MNNFYHQLVSLTTIESTINYFKTRVSVGDLSSRVREHRLKRCTIVRSNECTSEHSLEAVQLSNLRVFHPHTIPPMKYGGGGAIGEERNFCTCFFNIFWQNDRLAPNIHSLTNEYSRISINKYCSICIMVSHAFTHASHKIIHFCEPSGVARRTCLPTTQLAAPTPRISLTISLLLQNNRCLEGGFVCQPPSFQGNGHLNRCGY